VIPSPQKEGSFKVKVKTASAKGNKGGKGLGGPGRVGLWFFLFFWKKGLTLWARYGIILIRKKVKKIL